MTKTYGEKPFFLGAYHGDGEGNERLQGRVEDGHADGEAQKASLVSVKSKKKKTALVNWKRDAKDGKKKIQGDFSKPRTVKVKK